MNAIMTGEELKAIFTLDDWIQALDDDAIVYYTSDLTPGGAISLRTQDNDTYTL